MNDKKEIQWPDLLECYYGVSLNDHQAVVWFGEMTNPNNADLCAAIRRAGHEGLKPMEFRATVRDVSQWLKVYRAIQYHDRQRDLEADRMQGFKAEWKEKLSRGCPPDDFLAAVDALTGLRQTERNDICRDVMGR